MRILKMNMFDLAFKKQDPSKLPSWVNNDNERSVYTAVILRIREVEDLISRSDYPLKPSEYKIAKSVICKSIKLSGSYIAKHKDLNNWVNGHQRRLKRLASEIEANIKKRTYTAKKPEQMRKDELVKEIKKLRNDLKQRDQELYVEQLKELMNSGLTESQVITQERIKRLEAKINQLQKTNAELEVSNKALTDNLIEAIKEAKKGASSALKIVE